MNPSDWIGIAAIGVTVYLSQRAANSNLTATIQSMFTKRIEDVEADNILRDQWIDEVDKRVNTISGEIRTLDANSKDLARRVDKVENICDRRHLPRFSEGTM